MERYKKEFDRINKLLKGNPRGMTITEISNKLNMNRNSCAKYLDLLTVSGHVEMKIFGTAKVFYPSDRVPISTLIDSVIDGISLIDKNLRIVKINEAFCAWISINKDDIVGKKINEIEHDFFKDSKLITNIEKALSGNQKSFEKQYDINSKSFYFKINIMPIIFEDTEPGLCIILKDITDHKKAEIELKKSEAKFRQIFEAIPDTFFLIDKDTKILEYKGNLNEIYITSKKVIGEPMLVFIPEDLRTSFKETINTVLNTKKSQIFEYSQAVGDIMKYFEARILFYSENQVGIFIRDITIRKVSDLKIKESEEKFRIIADQSMMGILIFQNGLIKYVNKAAIEICEYSEEELSSWGTDEFIKIVHPDDVEFMRENTLRIRNDKIGAIRNFFIRIITKSGKVRWLEIHVKRIIFQGKGADLATIIDITEKKEVEDSLKESEEKFRLIAEQGLVGIIIFQDNKIKYVNKFASIISEYTKKELLNLSEKEIFNIVSPEFKEYINKRIKNLLQDPKKMSYFTYKIITKSKNIKWVDVYASVIKYQNRDAILIMFIDITEKKIIEKQIKESEEKFKTISEQSLMGTCILQDDKIKYVNKLYAETIGYTVEELLSWPPGEYLKVIHPDDREFVLNQAKKKQSGNSDVVINYIFKGVKKTGEIVWIEIYSKTINYEGRPADLITAIDLTEQIEIINRLDEYNAIFQALFEKSNIALLVHDFEGNLIKVNKKAMDILGYQQDEISNIDFSTIFSEKQFSKIQNIIKKLIKNPDKTEKLELKIKRKDGSHIWIENECILVNLDDSPHCVLVIMNDITNRKKVEHLIQ
ncbi:MAG: PAS domain-containing protein [Candidatus Helarchaeota archaeon]